MKEKLQLLIIDDDHDIADTLVDILRAKGFEADATYSGPQALEMIKDRRFDCVFTDIKMPQMNGVELHRLINDRHPGLPVLFMTAYATGALVKKGVERGAVAVLKKPLDIDLLLSFFSFLGEAPSIIIVDDDVEFCTTLSDCLRSLGYAVTALTDPHQLNEMLRPDIQVVILDMKLNSISGWDILKEIYERYPHIPVILVTGFKEEMAEKVNVALEVWARTCLYKPLPMEALLKELAEVRRQELRKVLKGLTGRQ